METPPTGLVECGGCRRNINLSDVKRIGRGRHACLLKLLRQKIPHCTTETPFCNQCYRTIANRNNKECDRAMKKKTMQSSIDSSILNDSAYSKFRLSDSSSSTSSSALDSINLETTNRNKNISPELDEYDEMVAKTPKHPINQAFTRETTATLKTKLLARKSQKPNSYHTLLSSEREPMDEVNENNNSLRSSNNSVIENNTITSNGGNDSNGIPTTTTKKLLKENNMETPPTGLVECGGCRRNINLSDVKRIGPGRHACLLKLLRQKIPHCTTETPFCNQCYRTIANRNNKECDRAMKKKTMQSSIDSSILNDSAYSKFRLSDSSSSTSSSALDSINLETTNRNKNISPELDEYDEMVAKTPKHPINQAFTRETTATLKTKLLARKSQKPNSYHTLLSSESEPMDEVNENNNSLRSSNNSVIENNTITSNGGNDSNGIEVHEISSSNSNADENGSFMLPLPKRPNNNSLRSSNNSVIENNTIPSKGGDDRNGIEVHEIISSNSDVDENGSFMAPLPKRPRLREELYLSPRNINAATRYTGG